MTLSITCPTLDLRPGHDLTIGELQPRSGLGPDDRKPAWDSASPSRCLCSLSLKINKLKKKKMPRYKRLENYLSCYSAYFSLTVVVTLLEFNIPSWFRKPR